MLMNNAPESAPYKSNTYRFLGLNRGNYTYNGELEDMTNMSTDEYPCAAPRGPREKILDLAATPEAVAAPDLSVSDSLDGFTGVMGGAFYYNGVIKSRRHSLPESYVWSIALYNSTYILNGYDDVHGKSLNYIYDASADSFSMPLHTMDNLILTAGETPGGECYLETYQYYHTAVSNHAVTLDDGSEMDGDTFYNAYGSHRESHNIFAEYFKVGDELEILGFPGSSPGGRLWYYDGGSGDSGEIREVDNYDTSWNNTVDKTAQRMSEIDSDAIVLAVVKKFEVTMSAQRYAHRIFLELSDKTGKKNSFVNMLSKGAGGANYYAQGVTLRLAYPAFSNIAVHNNRLWGTTLNGEQLFCSSAQYFFDFQSTSLATDELYYSFFTSTIPGKWTGLCEYEDVLLAFKDSAITVIYGDAAYNYSTKDIKGIGCIDPASIQCTPQGVIFLGYKGFYIYNGSRVPQLLSEKLYRSRYVTSVSGFDGNKYYAAAVMADGTRELLTYDFRYRLWHKQDDKAFKGFFTFKGDFYLCDNEALYKADSGNEIVQWSFTTVKTHYNSLDEKDLQDIWIRAECFGTSYFLVATSTDGAEWKLHRGGGSTDNQTVFKIPVHIERGSTFRIKIYGQGFVIFREIEVNFPLAGRRNKVTKTEESALADVSTPDYSAASSSDLIIY